MDEKIETNLKIKRKQKEQRLEIHELLSELEWDYVLMKGKAPLPSFNSNLGRGQLIVELPVTGPLLYS